jgi:hypothetical protein
MSNQAEQGREIRIVISVRIDIVMIEASATIRNASASRRPSPPMPKTGLRTSDMVRKLIDQAAGAIEHTGGVRNNCQEITGSSQSNADPIAAV